MKFKLHENRPNYAPLYIICKVWITPNDSVPFRKLVVESFLLGLVSCWCFPTLLQ